MARAAAARSSAERSGSNSAGDNAGGSGLGKGNGQPRMPETPEEFFARAAGALQVPPVQEWDSWPFEGTVVPKQLAPPLATEQPIDGAGGIDCRGCDAPESKYIWGNANWRLMPLSRPSGLPVVLLLEPRTHFAAPGDLPDSLAAELGVLISRIERAVSSVPGVGRVHIGRWGEGAEHLHWWFMARPYGFEQLMSSFAAVWDDVLPPATPRRLAREHRRLPRRLLPYSAAMSCGSCAMS